MFQELYKTFEKTKKQPHISKLTSNQKKNILIIGFLIGLALIFLIVSLSILEDHGKTKAFWILLCISLLLLCSVAISIAIYYKNR